MADCCRKIVIVETSGDDKSAKTIVRGIIIEISGEKIYRFDEKLADEVAKFAEGDIYVTTNGVDRRNVYMITDDMNDMIRKYMYTLAGGKSTH